MTQFSPSRFFDLTSFAHASLFEGCEFVWEALERIPGYLDHALSGDAVSAIAPGAYLERPEAIIIGEGTVIEPGAFIRGPCVLGARCEVRHGAYIRGGVIAGDDCVIGHATEIKNSILLNGAKAAHFAYVGDSILGGGVNLGAGVKLANLKLKRDEVVLMVDGSKVPTGRRKFGAILGDGVQLGCNSVTNPGTIMTPGVLALPCSNIGGYVCKAVRRAR
jgi:NDP-sugar pyrophosphorylase family protein